MNVDSDKPRFIECVYEATIEFDLEELGIEWEDIKDYSVKYGEITIELKNGDVKVFQGNERDVDYKWAVRENILTDSWDKVEGLNW